MLDRDAAIELIRQAIADVLGVSEAEVALDSTLSDLGLEADDLEDVAARLQSEIEIHIAPEEVFPDDAFDQLTVQSVVEAVERKTEAG